MMKDGVEMSSMGDKGEKVHDDLLMNQINDLTLRLQLKDNQIENFIKEQNKLLEEKRTTEAELEKESNNVENLKNRMEKKISFEK